MCYSGTCPYEGRNGGCNLSHHYETGRVPADAWCSEEEDFEEPEDENFQRISRSVERINALTKDIGQRGRFA